VLIANITENKICEKGMMEEEFSIIKEIFKKHMIFLKVIWS
jgi:hypothetical protein